MMLWKRSAPFALMVAITLAVPGASLLSLAASQNIDLDGKTATASESNLTLTIVQSFPAKIRNKVTNKAVGEAFQFRWFSAGPGGFSSAIAAGTSAGVGAIWDWGTTQSIYSFSGTTCANDICFNETSPNTAITRGPFVAPGRSLQGSNVTVSSASLSSSLITFFSPPQFLAQVTSTVAPLAGGAFGYTTVAFNHTPNPIVVDIAPGPPGCDLCDEGQTFCGGECTDTGTDPNNCGACGVHCSEGEVCAMGACTANCTEPQTDCDGTCTNTQTDPDHCGSCSVSCNGSAFGGCPYGLICQAGTCVCAPGLTGKGKNPCQFPGLTGETLPPGETILSSVTSPHPAREVESQLTICGAAIPDGQPGCDGSGDSASQGPLNLLVPDLSIDIGEAYVTPYRVSIADASGDRALQPGETADVKFGLLNAGPRTLTGVHATLSSPPIDLTNDGVSNPVAVGITGATVAYPDLIGMSGNGPCGGCIPGNPVTPLPSIPPNPIRIQIPATHPGDTGRPFNLHVTGILANAFAGPGMHGSDIPTPVGVDPEDAPDGSGLAQPGGFFEMDVPIVLGIRGACSPSAADGDFDTLMGLLPPMAGLVLPGETVPTTRPINRNATRPLKLRLSCAGVAVTGPTAPLIVGLTRSGVSVDPRLLVEECDDDFSSGGNDHHGENHNDDDNCHSLSFRSSGRGNYKFEMRTRRLVPGSYVLTIRMPNGQDYVTGFVIR